MILDILKLRRAAESMGAWCDEPVMLVDGMTGQLEFLVHEIGHALSLGIGLGPDLEQRVSKMIRGLARRNREENEALVLAAEAIALPKLGFIGGSDGFRDEADMLASLEDAGSMQGLTHAQIVAPRGTIEAHALALQIASTLEDLQR